MKSSKQRNVAAVFGLWPVAQDLDREKQFVESEVSLTHSSSLKKGDSMKTIKKDGGQVDPARVALLLGLSIGLGILVHEVFFLVGGAIAVGALAAGTAHALQEHADKTRPARQHH